MGIVVGIPLRFSKLLCAPWMSHYHDFSLSNFRLLNKTRINSDRRKQHTFTLATSSHAPLNGKFPICCELQ